MKIHNISLVGGIIGIGIIVCSIIRWFFLFNDPSQMVLGSSIGAIVCIFSYLYNWMKAQEEENERINKRIDSFTLWMGKNELK